MYKLLDFRESKRVKSKFSSDEFPPWSSFPKIKTSKMLVLLAEKTQKTHLYGIKLRKITNFTYSREGTRLDKNRIIAYSATLSISTVHRVR